MVTLTSQTLPTAAPARVLACGAFLKNTACLLDGTQVHWSPQHDDLATPEACRALDASLEALLRQAGGRVDAVAHDLHPDFASTRRALALADALGVPAIAVQHHQAHLALLQAEAGDCSARPLVGWALDGFGLGSDGQPWGGELLLLRGGAMRRLAHLPPLALPGGDAAAREPWRLAAAVLHALGRGDEIVPRFGRQVGEALARGLHTMLERGLNCPPSTSAGRWFDAAAGALGLSLRQRHEAEAAVALEQAASAHREAHPDAAAAAAAEGSALDLVACVGALFDEPDAGRGAARFHRELADGLVAAAVRAAREAGSERVGLGGGCFFNRLLSRDVDAGLRAAGLQPLRPVGTSCGDAGLALGQAWAAALQLAAGASVSQESCSCA